MARRGDGLYLRANTWYLDCRIDGKRHVVKLGKGINRTAAGELANVKRAAILKGEAGIGKKAKDSTFDEARAAFEAWAEHNKKPRTVHSYKECLGRLAQSFSGKRLSQISAFAVEKHKRDRKEAGAPVRANREVAVLRGLFNYCAEQGLFEGKNPTDHVDFFAEPREKDRVLTHEEEDRLLAACRGPLTLAVVIGLHCGLRMRSEIVTLRWTDLDLARRTLTVAAAYAKNGKTRTVPLNSTVQTALEQHPRHGECVFARRDGTPYESLHAGFRFACRRAGLTTVTPHTLRHTFASRLIAEGVDPIKVTKLAGWSSIKMLDRYAHAAPSGMAEAVERLVRNSTTGFTTPEVRPLVSVA